MRMIKKRSNEMKVLNIIKDENKVSEIHWMYLGLVLDSDFCLGYKDNCAEYFLGKKNYLRYFI